VPFIVHRRRRRRRHRMKIHSLWPSNDDPCPAPGGGALTSPSGMRRDRNKTIGHWAWSSHVWWARCPRGCGNQRSGLSPPPWTSTGAGAVTTMFIHHCGQELPLSLSLSSSRDGSCMIRYVRKTRDNEPWLLRWYSGDVYSRRRRCQGFRIHAASARQSNRFC
jgi:hypothetical protein